MAEGYNIYRGVDSRDNIDFGTPIATVGDVETAVIAQTDLLANRDYFYAIRPQNASDIEGPYTDVFVKIRTDANGEYALRPNSPALLEATPRAGDVSLSWTYDAQDEAAAVDEFVIYYDNRTGVVDYTYANRLTSVAAYTFTYTASLSDGTYKFAVRARSAAGIEDANLVEVSVIVSTTVPAAIESLVAEVSF